MCKMHIERVTDDDGDGDDKFLVVLSHSGMLDVNFKPTIFMNYLTALFGVYYTSQPVLLSGGGLPVLPLFILRASRENP